MSLFFSGGCLRREAGESSQAVAERDHGAIGESAQGEGRKDPDGSRESGAGESTGGSQGGLEKHPYLKRRFPSIFFFKFGTNDIFFCQNKK